MQLARHYLNPLHFATICSLYWGYFTSASPFSYNDSSTTTNSTTPSLTKSRSLECHQSHLHPSNASSLCLTQLHIWMNNIPLSTEIILSTDPFKATPYLGPVPQYIIYKHQQNDDSITSCEIRIEPYYNHEYGARMEEVRRAEPKDDVTNGKEIVVAGEQIIEGCLRKDMNGVFPIGRENVWVLSVRGSQVRDDR